VAGPIPLSMSLERVRWLGATVFWGNTETEVGVVRGSNSNGSTSLSGTGFSIYFRSLRTKHIYKHNFIHRRFFFYWQTLLLVTV